MNAVAWVAVGAGVYWLLLVLLNGRQRPGEPAHMRGSLPFLGVALDYGRDALAWVQRAAREHPTAFSCCLAGQRMIFITDVRAFPQVMREARKLEFKPVAGQIAGRAFGHCPIDQFLAVDTLLHNLYIKHLSGEGLQGITARVQDTLAREVRRNVSAEWQEVDMFEFVHAVTFPATADAIFGDGWCTPELHRQFRAFDAKFAMLAGGVPARAFGQVPSALEFLRERMLDLSRAPEDSLMTARQARMGEHGYEEEFQKTMQLGVFWASQTKGNTIPSAFWLLYHLCCNPEAMAAAQREVRAVDAPIDSQDGLPRFSQEQLDGMRVVSSCVSEALRLATNSMVIREAKETFDLAMPDDQSIRVYKGSRVVCFPPILHFDEEVFPDPTAFQYDRFLDPDTPRFKNGKRLTTPLVLFGGGVSMCPGRHFARNEMQALIAYLLLTCDFERLPGQPPAEMDKSRAGLGIMPPTTGVSQRMRVRLRQDG